MRKIVYTAPNKIRMCNEKHRLRVTSRDQSLDLTDVFSVIVMLDGAEIDDDGFPLRAVKAEIPAKIIDAAQGLIEVTMPCDFKGLIVVKVEAKAPPE